MDAYGALPGEWSHFSKTLGLTADLLPVVSNPTATISPMSKMKGLGKTPSKYNMHRQVAGITDWTSKQATEKDIENWSKENDYGICLQTRSVRGLDVDIADPDIAEVVAAFIGKHFQLPRRERSNSGKFLLAFRLDGEMAKRVIKTQTGIIEFLATGQQFIAVGRHPDGARYEWVGGLPDSIPTVRADAFEKLWCDLEKQFGVAPSAKSESPTKAKTLAAAISNDPTAQFLLDNGWVRSTEKDMRLHITCPFEDEHTSDGVESSTTYFPANTGGYAQGHFACLHAHCEHRTDADFKNQLGLSTSVLSAFDDLTEQNEKPTEEAEVTAELEQPKKKRFSIVQASDFSAGAPPKWLIRDALPHGVVGVIYGDSGSGKTFLALDMMVHMALGASWCGLRTTPGKTVYICAEGAGGFRKRLKAQLLQHGASSFDIGVMADTPDFMVVQDIKDIVHSVREYGKPAVIIVDTLAQVINGNENAGEDMGKVLSHCRVLAQHTGAMVILIHHSGKDAAKGARGHSSLRANAEAEVEVVRDGDDRMATFTKLKDDKDGQAFDFQLRPVVVGFDDENYSQTSCQVEYTNVF